VAPSVVRKGSTTNPSSTEGPQSVGRFLAATELRGRLAQASRDFDLRRQLTDRIDVDTRECLNSPVTFHKNIAIIKYVTRRARPAQLDLALKAPARWGGARPGAGRKPGPRPRVWHRARTEFSRSWPGLVTVRVRAGIPSLRARRLVRELEASLRETQSRSDFRVTHYSIQRDHVHLLVEAEDAAALSCGMKSVAARLARAVNRVFHRKGSVLDGRYHHRALGTPREVRAALAYVLLNSRKHAGERMLAAAGRKARIDPGSSGRWFEGWAQAPEPPADRPAVAPARTWLLRTGWRRHGLIRPDEVPRGAHAAGAGPRRPASPPLAERLADG